MSKTLKWILGIAVVIIVYTCMATDSTDSTESTSTNSKKVIEQDIPPSERKFVTQFNVALSGKEFDLAGSFLDSLKKLDTLVSINIAELESKLETQKSVRSKLKKFRESCDEFKKTCFYRHPDSPKYRNVNAFYFYFASDINKTNFSNPRLVAQYYANDWLFINKLEASIDGEITTLLTGSFERDHDSDVWEWADISLTNSTIDILERIASSDKTTLRFTGTQYHNDKEVTAKQKKALKESIEVYKALNSM